MPVLEHERVSHLVSGGAGLSWSRRRRYLAPCDRPRCNTSPVKLPLVSRDWQEHHQGTNYGIVLGGILGFVVLVLAGGYAIIRWRRARIKRPSITSHSEHEDTPIKGSPSVDSAPLLIITEHWTPTLNVISEHTEQTSALSTSREESTDGASQSSRIPSSMKEDMAPDMDLLQQRASASVRDPSLPGPSSLREETIANNQDEYEQEYRPYQEEAPFPPYRLQVASVDDLGTPNISASDSDSMQVNIPWRNSARFATPRMQSLPLESGKTHREPPSPLTLRNLRYSSPQPMPSPLHLRAVAEEEREQSQASPSRPPTGSSGSRRSAIEDNASMNESEGSGTASTLSSLAKLKLRFTGSAPFLPLIQESSPLDTDILWRRVQGHPSPSSMKSPSPVSAKRSSTKPPQSSSSHHLPSPRPQSPSHSASLISPHPSITPHSGPASPQPTSPKSVSSRSASPKPASPLTTTLSSPDPPVSPLRPPVTLPDVIDVPSVIKLTPDIPAVSSPISHPSPWQTHPSPLTLSDTFYSPTSASSLALGDLSEFPEPPSCRPRPLPKRPLPHIPPPPSYLPPIPPVRIPGQRDAEPNIPQAPSPQISLLNGRDVQANVSIVPLSQSSSMNNSPGRSPGLSNRVRALPSPGPSKLSLTIQ